MRKLVKVVLIMLTLTLAAGVCFAAGGHRGGGRGGGHGRGHGSGHQWHGGGGGRHGGWHHRGHGGRYGGWYGRGYNRACSNWNYWGSGYSTVFIGGAVVSEMIAPARQVYVQEVTTVPQQGYIRAPSEYIVECPKCRRQVDCGGIPSGAHASCPYCKAIIY